MRLRIGWAVAAAALAVACAPAWAAPEGSPAGRTLRHEAIVDATLDQAWAAFTTKDGVEAWMVPAAEVDLRFGGTLKTSYDRAEGVGGPATIVHDVLSYAPRRMISLKTSKSPAGFEHAGAFEKTWSVIRFETVTPNRTRIVISGMGWEEGPAADEAMAFFDKGNAWTLEQLRALFADEARSAPLRAARAPAERILAHETTVEAPVTDVWRAWTTAEGLESWLAGAAEIDLAIGGALATHPDAGAAIGEPGTTRLRILSFEPERMLSFTTSAPARFPEVAAAGDTWAVVSFEEVAPERTRVRITALGWRQGEQWEGAYEFFRVANERVLDRLRRRFGPEEQARRRERALELLGRLVGGDWIMERALPEGRVLRSRSVNEWGADGRSILSKGWLGGADGMFFHGVTLIWREPAPGTGGERAAPWRVRFHNVNENGDVAAGEIHLVGPERLVWDWDTRTIGGATTAYRVETEFLDEDRYIFRLSTFDEFGRTRPRLDGSLFRRVERAPASFTTLRRSAMAEGG